MYLWLSRWSYMLENLYVSNLPLNCVRLWLTFCTYEAHAYNVTIMTENGTDSSVIGASWTRGLVVQPIGELSKSCSFFFYLTDNFFFGCVAAAVTLIALVLACSNHIATTLFASLVSFLAAILTLIAFAIDIALFALVKHEMARFGGGVASKPGPGSSTPFSPTRRGSNPLSLLTLTIFFVSV